MKINLILSQISASLVMLSAGTVYLFSLYGPQLQHILKYQQIETSFIASCATTGLFLGGPIFGSLVDAYPAQSSVFLVFGGVLIASGYMIVAYIVEEILPRPHYLVLAIIYLAIGFGNASCYHCALATNYRNWPKKYRSVSVGLTVSFFGLSAFIFARIATAYFKIGDIIAVPSFLKFVALICLVLNILTVFTLTPLKDESEEENSPLLSQIIITDDAIIPEYVEDQEVYYNTHTNDSSEEIFYTPATHVGISGIQLEPISCFRSIKAYLLAFNMFSIIGFGIMYINNVALLPPELDSQDPVAQELQINHVATYSLMSFAARIVFGLVSDYFADRKVPKTTWSIFGSVVMTTACILGLYTSEVNQLYVVTIFVAMAYGIIWTIVPILVGEYFGLSNFASNWGWMTVVPAFSGYFFSYIFGTVYDRSEDVICKGMDCYHDTFVVATIFCATTVAGNYILFLRRTDNCY